MQRRAMTDKPICLTCPHYTVYHVLQLRHEAQVMEMCAYNYPNVGHSFRCDNYPEETAEPKEDE